ncbi:MAG TPA: histidine kinase, partial [Gemmatimonadaceae bacterium]|nr:histidine kinase [Gemmatimonadaceae bacterium]
LSTTIWWSVAEWLPWVALTPVILRVARANRPRRGARVRTVLALAAAGVAVATAQVLLEYLLDRAAVLATGDPGVTVRVWLAHGVSGPPLELSYLMPRKIGFSYMTYWAVVVAALALEYYRLFVDRDVRAARLEGALLSAQLEALQAQVQPHFLFNTLNAIASLIPEDAAAAEETIETLSELLRASLRESGRREITLARELELLELYLGIQRTRFQHRLRVQHDTDPALATALVPPMLLQPLVENAIRHGIVLNGKGGTVSITTRQVGDTLELLVEDDGPGLTVSHEDTSGFGLANTRSRLERLYGGGASLQVGNRRDGGALARVRLPLVRAVDVDPDAVRHPDITALALDRRPRVEVAS